MVYAYIAFGSNLGDRNNNIERAIAYLKEIAGVSVTKVSSVYETDPVGPVAQGKFLNGVIEAETTLLPDELLDRLKGIESRLGRATTTEENGPRPIDLDIIFYGDIVIDGERIKIPHPRMQDRKFVLEGLRELAPNFVHPRLHTTVKELYEVLVPPHENNTIGAPDAGARTAPEATQ